LFSTKRRESERYEEEQERCPVDLKKEETPFLIKSNLAGKTAFTGANAFFSKDICSRGKSPTLNHEYGQGM